MFLRSILILSSHLRQRLPSGLSYLGFPTEKLYAFHISPMHATYPAHIILLDMIIQTIFREANKFLALTFKNTHK